MKKTTMPYNREGSVPKGEEIPPSTKGVRRDGNGSRLKLMRLLQENNQMKNSDLASRIDTTDGNVSKVLTNIRERGFIKANKAILDPVKFGLGHVAFVRISLKDKSKTARSTIVEYIKKYKHKNVQDIHAIMGEFDLMVKIRYSDQAPFGRFVDWINEHSNVKNSESMQVMETIQETLDLHICSKDMERL
jgi:Lrp/AsnC family leucine-responsive transcriptional regulator